MRPPQARRHGPGHRIQRRSRPPRRAPSRRRASHTCTSSISTAHSPASRSTSDAVDAILRQSRSRCNSAAASATWRRSRCGSTRASPRHSRHGGGARSELVRAPAGEYPGRIAVGIDAKGGKVAVEGWAETSELTATELASASRTPASPPSSTPTSSATASSRASTSKPRRSWRARRQIPVIASGGLASIDDVEALLQPEHAMLEGAITGRALYDGRIDPKEALALLASKQPQQ